MNSQFINEKTAYLYALHESDSAIHNERQALLASLHLSLEEENFYQMIFDWYETHSDMRMTKFVNMKSFWIYAYAKQSEQFQIELKKHYFNHQFRNADSKNCCLKKCFMQCYTLIESGYPEMFVFESRNDLIKIGSDQGVSA